MKMKTRLLLFLLLTPISFLSFQLFKNQFVDIEWVAKQLNAYYQKSPVEKIYLHLDKPSYVAGETLWFKAYLQNSQSDTSDLSKVLYVELISPFLKIQDSKKLFITQLSSFGEIELPDTLSEGIYRVRAYTHYLRNAGTDYFFDKQVKIFNSRNRQKKTSPLTKSGEIDLQFFPEGGELVYGLRSTVGFKAVNSQGLGVAVEGEIYDNEGIKAATFKSNPLGMGSFKLTPSLNRIYQAKLKLASGKEASYYLPNVKQNGFVLGLENMPENRLRLRIFANLSGLEGKAKHFFIIAQQNGEIFYSVKDTTGKNALMSDIPKRNLPQGIVHFTLFDGNNVPQAERLVFINHQDFLRFSIGKSKESYQPREKIDLSVFIANAVGQGAETDFSISVVDEGKTTLIENEDNILTNLLLTSEMKGNIEQPAFYFQNTPESEKALDDLLLTQGWRRFKWSELINKELGDSFYKIEKGITIAGIAKNGIGAPFKNANVSVLNAINNIALVAKTDDNGRFEVSGLNFNGSADFAIQVENEKKTKAERIAITSATPPAVGAKSDFFDLILNTLKNTSPSNSQNTPTPNFSTNTQVLESVVVSSTALSANDPYKSMKPYGTPDVSVRGEVLVINAKGTSNVLYGLKGQAAGVQVGSDANGNFGVLIRGGINSLLGSSTALLLFDGIPVDFDFFNSVSPEDIDHIDIIKSEKAAAYGTRGSNGAIAAFSRRDYKAVDKRVGLINERVAGYSLAREFYNPNYITMKKEERNRKDTRTTIYWNPQIYADVNGAANISFFAADETTKYRVIIEGRSWRGTLGRKEMVIEVKK
jgi:hypothetical protein